MSEQNDRFGMDLNDLSQSDQIVLHVDMDCFYAACERLRDPSLEDEPVVVVMGFDEETDSGVVSTASYEAREYGVESAQPVSEALERLPRDEGYYLPVDSDYYDKIASEVKSVLHKMADIVREISIDEAYLDVTESTMWDRVEGYAQGIKTRIDQEIGVTASIGVAPNMSAAKVASDHDKPDGLHVVPPGEVREFFAPLDVEEVHEVGEETARELRQRGIETAGDLAEFDPEFLKQQYGSRGEKIYRYARGEDQREVTPADPPKSFLRDTAFTEPIREIEQKREQIRTLAEGVAARARNNGAMYQTVGIKVVEPPFEITRRSRSLSGPVDDPDLVEQVALGLLEEFHDVPVRKLGVTVKNLTYSDQEQASLGGWGSSDAPAEVRDDSSDGSDTENSTDEQTSITDF